MDARFARWYTCSLCEQKYHGDVKCAYGWACWKTYLGRPEGDWPRLLAMQQLGNGLISGKHYEDALSVKEAELSIRRRLGDSEHNLLITQSNFASTYQYLGRLEEALSVRQEVYSGYLKLLGREHQTALTAATNYASTLRELQRFDEAKALLRRTMPVVRRVLGEGCDTTLRMRWCYAQTLYCDLGSTLNDLNEAVSTLEAAERTARRVLGGAHPITTGIEGDLRDARVALGAREGGDVASIREAVAAMTAGDA